MGECNKNHNRIGIRVLFVMKHSTADSYTGLCVINRLYSTNVLFGAWFMVLMGKSEESVSAKESDGWQQRVLLTEIIFLLIGKAICSCSEVALANNNVRSAAMDICSSVTRCFTLLKLDTHIALSQENRRRCYSRVENYRFVSVCPVPLFSMGIFCPYITR